MNRDTIAAVIVTYNRSALLDQVIEHLASQTRKPDCIIIINNCSTDNTTEVVNKHANERLLNIDLVNLPRNIGGAGGFYEGAKKAYEDGFDLVWFMDDDTMPQSQALEFLEFDLNLFEAKTKYRPAFICSVVLWKNDDICEMNIPKPIWDWPRFLFEDIRVALVESCSFVSVLVRREKIKSAGYPIPEFFIWYDDVEYTKRLTQQGYPGIMSMRSKVHHFLPENKGVNYSLITEDNAWKFKYGLRNEGAVILRNQGLSSFFAFGIARLSIILKLSISNKTKFQMIKSWISGTKLKYTIEYPD